MRLASLTDEGSKDKEYANVGYMMANPAIFPENWSVLPIPG
jgi:hypothetical protein